MNCTELQHNLDRLIQDELDSQQTLAADTHLQQCARCQSVVNASLRLQQQLAQMPVPENPGYQRRMLSFIDKLEQDQRKSGSSGPSVYDTSADATPTKAASLRGFVTGFAAALVLCFLVVGGFWISGRGHESVSVGSINLIPKQTKNVSLVFHVPGNMEKATLRIELPGDVELKGYPGKRTISWKTSLKHGANKLVLPLKAKGSRGGDLKASVTWNGKTKIFWVGLSVTEQSSFQFIIQEQSG